MRFTRYYIRNEQNAVKNAPNHEMPLSAVPKSAQSEDNDSIENYSAFSASASTEGNIHIVAKPACECDVPAPPQFGDACGEIGAAEIVAEAYSEQLSATHGDVGITREVGINLNAE